MIAYCCTVDPQIHAMYSIFSMVNYIESKKIKSYNITNCEVIICGQKSTHVRQLYPFLFEKQLPKPLK